MKIRFGPYGVHAFFRTTGLNLLFDEFIVPEISWTVAPRHVSIALTNTCDLTCSYCFAPKTRATLSFGNVVSWLHELDANGTIGIGFGGGEPTLYKGFADLCAYTARNTELAVSFTTHGHHLDEQMLRALRGNVHFIRVSMDGVGETYRRLRGRPFVALRARLDAIRDVVPFGINYVVNSDTLSEIDSAVELAEITGAAEFLVLPEQPANGRGGNPMEVKAALRDWVEHYSGNLRLSISERGSEGMPTCDPLPDKCGLNSYVHVDAHGTLKHTSYDSVGIGIGEDGIMSALARLRQPDGS